MPLELTGAQHAILEELARSRDYDSVRVSRDLNGYVILAPYVACPNCQPCQTCNDDEGLVPAPGASARIVSPDGVTTEIGHTA